MNERPTNAPSPMRRLLRYAALMACALAVLAWRGWPDGKLHVIFLETKGDAALIQTPAGGYVLIDGGGDPAALAAALGRHMPFWRRTLDAIVLTSVGGDRLPGQVAALTRYHATMAIVAPATSRSALLAEWQRLGRAEGTPVRVAHIGERFGLGGARLRVLALGEGKAPGMVLRLEYGTTSVVFDQSALADATAQRPTDLLAFPWEHDPRTNMIAALRPRAIVFTESDSANQPAELTYRERAVGGARLYHERLNGTITWISDGRRAWVTTER